MSLPFDATRQPVRTTLSCCAASTTHCTFCQLCCHLLCYAPSWPHPILVHVRGDHQFYSATPLSDSDPHWLDGKTGLGSSATLVSSLVGALCHYFQLIDSSDQTSAVSDSSLILLHSSLLPQHISSTMAVSAARVVAGLVFHRRRPRPVHFPNIIFGPRCPICSSLSLPRAARPGHLPLSVSGRSLCGSGEGWQRLRCVGCLLWQSNVPGASHRAALLTCCRGPFIARWRWIGRPSLQCVLPEVEHEYHVNYVASSEAASDAATSCSLAAPLSAPPSPSSAIAPNSASPSSSYSSLSELDRTPSPVTPPACSLCSALRGRRQWGSEGDCGRAALVPLRAAS